MPILILATLNLNEDWSISVNGLYHFHTLRSLFLSHTLVFGQETVNQLAEVSIKGRVFQNTHLLFGGIYDNQQGDFKIDPINFTGDWNITNYGIYSQLDHQLFDWLKIVAGLQFNKREGGSNRLSPRVGVIFQFNRNWGAKVLYGEAFRSPVAQELQSVVPPFGNPNLKPESIQTFDVQVNYKNQRAQGAITYFTSLQKDIITGTTLFQNMGEIRFHGVEFEGKLQLTQELSFLGNFSFQINKDTITGQSNATIPPSWMAKFGFSYECERGVSLSVFNSYFGEPTQNSELLSGVMNINPNADAYNLLTANIILEMGKVLEDPRFDFLNLSLYMDNLLDEDIYYTSTRKRTFNTLPHHLGRGFYGKVTLNF